MTGSQYASVLTKHCAVTHEDGQRKVGDLHGDDRINVVFLNNGKHLVICRADYMRRNEDPAGVTVNVAHGLDAVKIHLFHEVFSHISGRCLGNLVHHRSVYVADSVVEPAQFGRQAIEDAVNSLAFPVYTGMNVVVVSPYRNARGIKQCLLILEGAVILQPIRMVPMVPEQ